MAIVLLETSKQNSLHLYTRTPHHTPLSKNNTPQAPRTAVYNTSMKPAQWHLFLEKEADATTFIYFGEQRQKEDF